MRDLNIPNITLSSISSSLGTFYCDFPGHSHGKNCFELHYVISGRGSIYTNNHLYKLFPNYVYITGPHIYHKQETDTTNRMSEFCLYFEVEKHHSDILLQLFLEQSFWYGKANTKIKNLFKQAHEYLNSSILIENRIGELVVQQLIYELIKLYHPRVLELTCNSPSSNNSTALVDWFFLYNKSNVTLSALATTLGLGKRQTERFLTEKYNMSFQQMKNESRVEQIKIYLSTTDMTIARITEQCDFYNSSALSTFFKKNTGLTPSEYRKKNNSLK